MKLNLPDTTYSAQDVQTLMLEVREYARWYAQTSIKKRVGGKAKLEQPTISAAAAELIHDWSIKKPLSTHSLDELIAALDNFKDNSPTMTIVLAAPPTGAIKKQLVSWCRANLTPNVLVQFEFNTTLLGGMVVRIGSHIYDWSFRRQILENRMQLPEVLRNV